jgi:ATP-dependent Clp protease ATP-binding subunit ClpA
MFTTIKRRVADVTFIGRLCTAAEQQARALGQTSPGSEHFVMAALELPDGSAGRVFQRLGIDAVAFRTAIDAQFREALTGAGIGLADTEALAPMPPVDGQPAGVYQAAPSAQVFMQRLAASRPAMGSRALVSADVLLAVSQEEFSIATRTFRQLSISAQQLAHVAKAELAGAQSA